MKVLLAIALLATTAWTVSAQGTFQAITNYSTSTSGFVNGTAGWTFQVTAPVTVTALGAFTNAIANADGGDIQVGLWRSNGSLVASNLITAASALTGLTRYESVIPVFLDPGQVYYMGAYSVSGITTLDVYAPGDPGSISVNFSPEVQLGGPARADGGFVFPNVLPGPNGAIYLGGNFQFNDRVPEPSAFFLVALGGCLLGALRRKYRPI
jgi:hypothetical protein